MASPRATLRLRQLLPAALLLGIFGLALAIASGARLAPADFTFNNGAEPASLDPQIVSGVPEGRILRAIFEGLTVQHPETLEPLPGVAESWELSEDGRVWTFHIREGAHWSNGDEITAWDFDYSWRRCLTPKTGALYAYQLWYIEGAEAYTSEVDENGDPLSSWESVGVKVLDRHTLQVTLNEPVHYFLHLLAFYTYFPVNRRNIEEAQERWPETWPIEWLRPENIVTNGPYRIAERRINDRIRMVKSETYWDRDNVAMRTIDALAIEQLGTGLNVYLTGGHSWVDKVPTNLVPELRKREDFDPAPYFGSYYYRVNTQREPFGDVRVRRALSLTIPRRDICEKITKAGEIPAYALVPPLIEGYTNAECEREDTHKARQLLAEAGFGPNGKPFPTFEIHYNTQEMHRDIAEVIANAWQRELGLDVKLLNQEWKVYLDTQTTIAYDVSRSAWIGDYPDPMTFLDLMLTDGENNRTGWRDPRYDELIKKAQLAVGVEDRMRYFHEAEAIMMEQVPILPIYYYVTRNIVNPRLGGFHPNFLDTHFPKFWYWMDDEELEARRRTLAPGKKLIDAPGPRQGLYSPARMRERRGS